MIEFVDEVISRSHWLCDLMTIVRILGSPGCSARAARRAALAPNP